MSLATRCPACGTVFRVVQDQLKVSDGWVRCGRCAEVFNALEGLFDLSRDSGPVPLDEPTRTPAGTAPSAAFAPPPPAPPAFAAADPVFEAPDLGTADARAPQPGVVAGGPGPHEDGEIAFEHDAAAADAGGFAPTPGTEPITDAAPDGPEGADGHAADLAPGGEPAGDGRVEPAFDAPQAWAPVPQDMEGSGHAELHADRHSDMPADMRADWPSAPAPADVDEADEADAALDAGRAGPDAGAGTGGPSDIHTASAAPSWPPADDARPDADASLSRPAFEDAQFPADALNEDPPVALSPAARRPRGKAATGDAAVPGFVRQADRAARWQRPGVRVLLSLLVLVLTGTLAGQIAWHWRDRFAAQQPAWRPWLAQGCEWLGCSLQPPRRPDALRVESSTLNKAGADVYRLTVVLRNTADHPVRSPHLDLTLTDNDGAVVARRAIGPELVAGATAALDAQAEASWQLTLSSGGRRVSGYTVAAFYP